ncbi:hypothetical protein [Bartonella sp. DGB1]|uniref:hypothetical protein n=1 Tax=Bartonella sp. DGB1 TaxID=3239807 RepID=UPI003523FFF1
MINKLKKIVLFLIILCVSLSIYLSFHAQNIKYIIVQDNAWYKVIDDAHEGAIKGAILGTVTGAAIALVNGVFTTVGITALVSGITTGAIIGTGLGSFTGVLIVGIILIAG